MDTETLSRESPEADAERTRQLLLLRRAAEAAAHADPTAMLEALHHSGLLAAVARRLRRRYPRLAAEEADIAVGEAVESFYRKCRKGGSVEHPVAYLAAAARHVVLQRYLESWAATEQSLDSELAAPPERVPEEDESRLEAAVAVARRLVPLLGEENVQRVVGYFLDAIEAGVVFTAPEAAEALGLNPASVRKWLERGLRRMQVRARKLDLDRELERLREEEQGQSRKRTDGDVR